jgi:hypothetical protein
VEILGPGEIRHVMDIREDVGPAIDEVKSLRDANFFKQGWTDQRTMKLNARIPASVVYQVEHLGCPCCRGRKFDLSEKKDYREFLILHPEYVVAPVDTGRSGKIIIK